MTTLPRQVYLAPYLLTALLSACVLQPSHQPSEQIDAHLSQLSEEGGFSGAVLVASDGAIIHSGGYGLADAEHQIPNTPHTRFRIHWITMQFTATAILMLQETEQLHVQDPICLYVSDCPGYWRKITIHHLLTHTSGMSDWIRPWGKDAERPANSAELVARLTDKPPYFTPGEKFRYSENGYIVLGHIIESVSGQTYDEFIRQHIFDPLGMQDSGYGHEGLAVGYTTSGKEVPPPDLLYRYAASGLYSSAADLYLWDQALYGSNLLSQDSLALLFSEYAEGPSRDFPDTKYGYGWFVGEVLDRPAVLHGGMMNGFTSMLLRFPQDRVTIIVLRNYGIDVYDGLEIDLARIVFES